MINLLMHDNILVRIGSTIAFTLVLLAIIWLLSSLFLPPGLVKLGFVESLVTSSPHTTTAQILGANMLLGAFGLILMNQWHDPRGLATGYYIHFFRSAVFHGLLRGTNSFAFPYPSQAEIVIGFFKVGLWETLAFCLICSATAVYAIHPIDSPQGLKTFFTLLSKPSGIKRDVLFVLIIGGLVLVFAAIMEALNIFNG